MKRAVLLGTIAALLVAVAVTAAGGRTPLFQMIFHAAGTGAADRTVFSKLSDVVSVYDFGATGDGVTDDTATVQAAITAAAVAGKQLIIPSGTFIIEGAGVKDCGYTTGVSGSGTGGIAVPSNSSIFLAPGAILKQKTNTTGKYNVLRLEKVTNVQITGGTIDGNRTNVTAPATEWGYGIAVCGATNVVISNMTLQNMWGDGIFIQEAADLTMSSNIQIANVTSTGNRRQGMSVIGVNGLIVQGSIFQNTSGTAPQDGVDIEPGGSSHSVTDMTFTGCIYRSNAGRGIFAQGTGAGTDVASLNIVGGVSISNTGDGVGAFTVTGNILISGISVVGNGGNGIFVQSVSDAMVSGNYVSGNNTAGGASNDGISMTSTTRGVATGNIVRKGAGPNFHRYGLALLAATNTVAFGNDLQTGGTTDFNNFTPSNSTFFQNVISGNLMMAYTSASPTYGAAITIDPAIGLKQVITVTNGTAFTINNPATCPVQQLMTVQVKNTSGGALGAATWSANYHLAGAWAQPATGNNRSITFQCDNGGTLWYEVARNAADVPN